LTSNQFFIKHWPEKKHFWLEGEEHHHLSRVVRIKAGDKIWLTDGQSRRLLAEVVKVEEEKTWLQALTLEEENLKASLRLGFGLTKPQTADFIIQKVTELGVAEVQPLITRRAFKISAERLETRLGRWQKIAQQALKQSKGAVLPLLRYPETLDRFLSADLEGLKLYLDEDSQVYLKNILLQDNPGTVILIVGPEGGLAKDEKDKLREKNFQGVSLGKRILRTETAIISALAMISHFWNW